ncbi:MAG TPA: tripartite tricarboxylate transporter substrate binding protein [Xanthobacteraceae bacterium]
MRRRSVFAALTVLAVVAAQSAQSEPWPQKPVKIVVPFAPGGNTDGIARLIAQPLGATFGQQFVVENRAGAAGVVATEAVVRSPADGYTLLMGTPSQITIAPAMAKTPYDPVRDLAAISIVATNPYVLVINPALPARTLPQFIDYVRGRPEKLTYAAPVFGGLSHLSMVLFLKRAGLEMTPVSYKGGAAPLADIIAGHVPVYFATLSEAVSQARSGTVHLLAVSSEKRVPQLPDVPTFAESGFPGLKAMTWNGLMAPAAVPKEIIGRIATAVEAAAKDADFAKRLASFGVDPVGSTPEQFAATIAADLALWGEAVKLAGIGEK